MRKTFSIANINTIRIPDDTYINITSSNFSNIGDFYKQGIVEVQYKIPAYFNFLSISQGNGILFKTNLINPTLEIRNTKKSLLYDHIIFKFSSSSLLGCFSVMKQGKAEYFACLGISNNGMVASQRNGYEYLLNNHFSPIMLKNSDIFFSSDAKSSMDIIEMLDGKYSLNQTSGFNYTSVNNTEFLTNYTANLSIKNFNLTSLENIEYDCSTAFGKLEIGQIGVEGRSDFNIPLGYFCETSSLKGNNSIILNWEVNPSYTLGLLNTLKVMQNNFLQCLPVNHTITKYCGPSYNHCLLNTVFDQEICCEFEYYNNNVNKTLSFLDNIENDLRKNATFLNQTLSPYSFFYQEDVTTNPILFATCYYGKNDSSSFTTSDIIIKNYKNRSIPYVNVPFHVIPLQLDNLEYLYTSQLREVFANTIKNIGIACGSLLVLFSF